MLNKIIAFFLAIYSLFLPDFGELTPVTQVNKADKPAITVTSDLTIMTYNVKVSGIGKYLPMKRKDNLIKNVKEYMPDSVGFEEVNSSWYGWLKEGLTEYDYVGKGRNKGNTNEASPIFYLKDKYELIEGDTFWLSPTPDTPSKGWDARYNRVCTYVILKNKETGFKYAHFNAHFDHIGERAREESVAVVSKMIAEKCPDIPVIFSGDLNEKESSPMYDRIIECGLRDSKYLAKESMDTITYHGYSEEIEKENTEPIDFIFVNDYCVDVASYKVDFEKYDGIYPSDHHPIIVKLTLGN